MFDTAVLAVQYALSGEGIALVDTYLFGDYIAHGRLVKPFERQLDDGYGYYLITHPEGLERYRHRAVPLVADRALRQRAAVATPPVHLAVSNE